MEVHTMMAGNPNWVGVGAVAANRGVARDADGKLRAQQTTHIEESDLPERSETTTNSDDGAGARVEQSLDRAGEATHRGIEHGAEPVGRGLDNAMKATGHGLREAIDKTGDAPHRAGGALDGTDGDN
jgi:hypothetical protein